VSRRRFAVTALAAAAVTLVTIPPLRTRLICNLSPSAPVGIYWLTSDAPKYGDLAVVHLPLPLGTFADARRYLPRSFLLLKPVAATAGDVVCRVGQRVWINRRRSMLARTADGLGRPLRAWRGCRRLAAGELFLLSPAPGSFDSRYFGPLEARHIIGTAIPIFTVGSRRKTP
jgi:conjugative transfer signal peptidase TraF